MLTLLIAGMSSAIGRNLTVSVNDDWIRSISTSTDDLPRFHSGTVASVSTMASSRSYLFTSSARDAPNAPTTGPAAIMTGSVGFTVPRRSVHSFSPSHVRCPSPRPLSV